MNRKTVLTTLLGAMVIAATSFAILSETQQKQKQSTPPKPAAKPVQKPSEKGVQKKAPKKRKRLAAVVAQVGAPEIAVSVNGTREGLAREGSPVLIECSVYAPRNAEGPIRAELAKASGHWGEMFRVEIRDSAGKSIPGSTPKLLFKPGASIVIDGAQGGRLAWSVEFPPTQPLPNGIYKVTVVLDSSTASAGWKGKAQSPPCDLDVRPANAQFSQDERRLLAYSEVRILAFGGKNTEAIAACDRLIGIDGGDVTLHSMKGDALARTGKHADAVLAYDRALSMDVPAEEGDIPEPPFVLLEKRRVAAEKAKRGGQ